MQKLRLFSFLVALCFVPLAAMAAEGDDPALSADEAARQLVNPNTPLASLTLRNQYRWYEGDLPGADNQSNFSLTFQPSFPFPVNDMDSIFFRPAIPILFDQPYFDANDLDFDGKTALGDIGFDLAWGRTYKSGLLVAAGMVASLPTATSSKVASKELLMGPEVFLGLFKKWGIVGIFPNHVWDVAGWSGRDTSLTTLQPFAIGLPGNGWSVGTAPIITYNWESEDWTIPLQLQASKTIKAGKTPLKFAVELNYYVEKPDEFGPEWMLGFNITPVIKNPFIRK